MTSAFALQTLSDVERVDAISEARFCAEFLHQRPVVLTGLTNRWPAVGKWTPAWLSDRCGGTIVTARQYQNDGSRFSQQAITRKARVSLRRWVDFLHGTLNDDDNGPLAADAAAGLQYTWSLRESKELFSLHRKLLEDARFEVLFPSLAARFEPFLWFGPAGYVTGLHTDLIDLNLLLHLHGEKELVLYAPDQTERMYPEELVIKGGLYSLVNAYEPDLDRHPLFASAVGQRATLAPGELMYVPKGWWHMVRSHDVTISLTASCARLPDALSDGEPTL